MIMSRVVDETCATEREWSTIVLAKRRRMVGEASQHWRQLARSDQLFDVDRRGPAQGLRR
jgi:hypothetical protein